MANSSEAQKLTPEQMGAEAPKTPESQVGHPEAAAPNLEVPANDNVQTEKPVEDLEANMETALDALLKLEGLNPEQTEKVKALVNENSEQIFKQAERTEDSSDTISLLVQTHVKDAVQKVKAAEVQKTANVKLAEEGPLGSGKEVVVDAGTRAFAESIGEDPENVALIAETYNALDNDFKANMPKEDYYGTTPLTFEDAVMMPEAPKLSFLDRIMMKTVESKDIAFKTKLFKKIEALTLQADVASPKDISGNVANVDSANKIDPSKGGIK
jgi:hypothetical protein